MSAFRNGLVALAAALATLGADAATLREADIQGVYDRLAAVPQPTEYEVRHILTDSREKAQLALDRLHAGEDFATLAAELSIDKPGATQHGGDLGWNLPQFFVPEFSREMVALAPHGLSSAPVRTEFGWHILEVRGARPKVLPPLSTMHDQIAERLTSSHALDAQAATITYSDAERARLGYCAGLTDNAYSVAHRRLALEPRDAVKKLYDNVAAPARETLLALVDKVYDDQVFGDWDYATTFFVSCTRQSSAVPRERLARAGFCMQNRLIAAASFYSKAAGETRDVPRARFAYFDSPATLGAIDNVYASDKSLTQVESDAWDACIGDGPHR